MKNNKKVKASCCVDKNVCSIECSPKGNAQKKKDKKCDCVGVVNEN